MLELKTGCSVPFPEKLFEGYEPRENVIYANINASRVLDMMKRFAEMNNEPMFFILELPRRYYDGITESKILRDVDDYDVYFIDGMDVKSVCDLLDTVGPFLVKDGMNLFGVGCHESGEEILFGRYNVMTLYTKNAGTYRSFFDNFGIKETDNLVTAWDTFDREHAGECRLYVSEVTGKTIYDIPEVYKDYGMYLYEEVKSYDQGFVMKITHEEMLGKTLLIGITYYTDEQEFIEQKQYWGVVTEANEARVCIKQKDGGEFSLPGDLSSTMRARPGEYKLRSTGEVVVDPDFLCQWNITKEK